jgi:hypothetical protein
LLPFCSGSVSSIPIVNTCIQIWVESRQMVASEIKKLPHPVSAFSSRNELALGLICVNIWNILHPDHVNK